MRDYLPGFERLVTRGFRWSRRRRRSAAHASSRVPIPHDCRDGFLHAYWRRPHAYLDPQVRAGISVFALMERTSLEAGSCARGGPRVGAWERARDLLELDEFDLGYRLVVGDG